MMKRNDKMIEIIAHRGYSGKYPENTMTAFKAAEKSLADGIEMDVRFTKDKQLVVIHDETVNRTTDGKGLVSDRKSTRLNSSHVSISYAVFCLKKKKKNKNNTKSR